ncbi:hypothetical protein [Arthrobacter sp. KK5.5]|uniref:hypothetical protein n=1 Tax=Arthrobacter sp. KK5.5 TaxID=3373084 RepID=UPI003EE56E06
MTQQILPDSLRLHPTEKTWISAWIVTVTEPLTDARRKVEYERRIVDIATTKAQSVASLFTGAISMLMQALPDEDPWRNLQTTADGDTVMDDGGALAWDAATDLIPPSSSDLRLDALLSALVDAPDDAGMALLAAGPKGWPATLHRAELSYKLIGPSPEEAESMVYSLMGALRWAAFRYQSYRGRESVFPTRALSLALQYYAAPLLDDEQAMLAVDTRDPDYAIEPGAWRSIIADVA